MIIFFTEIIKKIKPSNFRRAINAFKRIGSSIADDFQRDEAAKRIQNHNTQITKNIQITTGR